MTFKVRPSAWQVQALGLLLLFLLLLIAVPFFAQRIPEHLQGHVSSHLKQNGFGWVSVNTEGRNVTLIGNAPTIKDAKSALDIAQNHNVIGKTTNDMTPRLIQPYTMKMNWDGQSLAVDGYVPDDNSHAQWINASQRLFGEGKVHGRLQVGAGSPVDWNDLLNTGMQALAKLQQGSIEITNHSIYMTGKTPHLATREEVVADLANYTQYQSAAHIVAADEADRICQDKFNLLLANNRIGFTANKANIEKSSYPLLSKLANVASLCPKAHITIQGHTDNLGSDEANMQLSQKRAQATVAWLFQQGIAIDRLTAVGEGEHKPIADNATETGRGRNRRIEFVVKPRSEI